MAKARVMYYMPVWGKWIGLGIAGWTWLFNWFTKKFSHVELWTPDENGRFTMAPNNSPMDYWGDMFTSTMGQTGGKNRKGSGVVLRPASEVLKHPERWWYQEIEIDDCSMSLLRGSSKAFASDNISYDKKAILGFFLPWRIHDKDKFICSEIVWYVLCGAGILQPYEPKIFSPRRMSKRIYEYCCCPISEMKKLVKESPND